MFNNAKLATIIVIIILAAIVGLFYWYQTSRAEIGNLNIYSGSAELLRNDKSLSAGTGFGVNANDVVKMAPDSRVSIILKDGSVIRLEAGSEVTVGDIEYSGQKIKNAFFYLKIGRMWSNVMPLATDGSYSIETPTIVAAVRGTQFNVDYLNESSKVFSLDHKIEVVLKSNRGDIKNVNANQLLTDFAVGPVPAPPDYVDGWIVFNLKEDEVDDAIFIPVADTKVPPVESVFKPTAVKEVKKNQPPTKKIVSLRLIAERNTAFVGEPIFLRVLATYADGSSADTIQGVSFTQKTGIGQVDNLNNFRGFSAGVAVLTARLGETESNPVEINIMDRPQEKQADQAQQQQQQQILQQQQQQQQQQEQQEQQQTQPTEEMKQAQQAQVMEINKREQ